MTVRVRALGAFRAAARGHDGKVLHLDCLFPSLGSAAGSIFDILDLLDGDIRIDRDLRATFAELLAFGTLRGHGHAFGLLTGFHLRSAFRFLAGLHLRSAFGFLRLAFRAACGLLAGFQGVRASREGFAGHTGSAMEHRGHHRSHRVLQHDHDIFAVFTAAGGAGRAAFGLLARFHLRSAFRLAFAASGLLRLFAAAFRLALGFAFLAAIIFAFLAALLRSGGILVRDKGECDFGAGEYESAGRDSVSLDGFAVFDDDRDRSILLTGDDSRYLRAFLATARGSHQYDSGCQNKFVNLHIANNLKCALLI